nr:molybdopterin biosynthesis protein [Ahnfeltia fastigiata]
MLNPKINLVNLSRSEYKRYARHLTLENIGVSGQKRIKEAKILCVGAGGLASSALIYLAACGIGHICIIDNDIVDISNLQRQILYKKSDVGINKVSATRMRIQEVNPLCKLETLAYRLTENNAISIINRYDIVIDGSDNFETRYIISKICFELHKIHIYGAIQNFEGQVSVFNYKGGPNYYDLYPLSQAIKIQSCNIGVLGILPGTIGMIQATEAIKIITGAGNILNGYLLIYDALNMSFKKIKLRSYTDPAKYNNINRYFIQTENLELERNKIDSYQLHEEMKKHHNETIVIDVRQISEFNLRHIDKALNIPIRLLKTENQINNIKTNFHKKKIILYCSNDSRSLTASALLSKNGIVHQRLKGGFTAWTKFMIQGV